MTKRILLLSLLVGAFFGLKAQKLADNKYINWRYEKAGNWSADFVKAYNAWEKGKPLYDSEDDHFFISRVKSKIRFRNVDTQTNAAITEENDKRILPWVPMNNDETNALPDGVFDSEVFSMWPYIHHFGNWTAPFVRMPGNFADVAHKNGVGVSVLAGIPWNNLTTEWQNVLNAMINGGTDKMADFLSYYGIDGLGYNSEFSTDVTWMNKIINYHKDLYAKTRGTGRMPLYEMIWYDGTNDNGDISFDRGLAAHNDDIFGKGSAPVTTSLFFNYNWNSTFYINNTLAYAKRIGRNSLDIYAGLNMQGGEPRNGVIWPLLKQYNYSIGLWGAHSKNMWWESRGEQGANPNVTQRVYQLRLERYFNGGNRNPINRPEISDRAMNYNAYNYNFMGLAEFTSAKSSLSWDLGEEPFISYFNLGNGKFFNLNGKRVSNKEWYNIGIQDYLPTWRWWFADKFLGRDAANAAVGGLDAEFIWDDAWFGGSLMRVWGTHANEYLHLFKTKYEIKSGDVITVRYKVRNGSSDISLALATEDNVATPIKAKIAEATSHKLGQWIEKSFVVGETLNGLAGKTLAMIALHFENAKDLNVYLGEVSIVRGSYSTPEQPINIKTKVLNSNYSGVDGKIIFDMPNSKPAGEVCYNLDVKTSMFKLYAQQKDSDPVFMGATTSWAGMYYSIPFDYDKNSEIRYGVSAVSLDMKSESKISWGEYQQLGKYNISDDIKSSKTTIKPNESFTISFVDDKHEKATFELFDSEGNSVRKVEDVLSVEFADGLPKIGVYDLKVTGAVGKPNGTRPVETRTFGAYVQITAEALGAQPEIYTLTANDQTDDVNVEANEVVVMKYTGRDADGTSSRGLDLKEQGFGFKAADLGLTSNKSFTLAFWLKVNAFHGGTQLLNIRDKMEGWPKTDWGWLWNFLDKDGKFGSTTFRGTDATRNKEFRYDFSNVTIKAGPWTHLAYVFDFNDAGQAKLHLYVNGVKQAPKGWTRTVDGNVVVSGTGEPDYQSDIYSMRGQNIVAIGGSHFDNGGLDGTVDNFQYWEKALTADEVKVAMGDFTTNPQGLKAMWTFENEPKSNDYRFEATQGSATPSTALAGMHNYQKADGEGQGTLQWIEAQYMPGCPFVAGTSYKVVTLPHWDIDLAEYTAQSGDGKQGSASIKFANSGQYTATLTLENGWGKDTKTFSYIIVGGTSVDELGADTQVNLFPNPFVEQVNVKFANAGKYTVVVFDANGRLVSQQLIDAQANEFASIKVNGSKGLYMVNIKQGEKTLSTVKVIKK